MGTERFINIGGALDYVARRYPVNQEYEISLVELAKHVESLRQAGKLPDELINYTRFSQNTPPHQVLHIYTHLLYIHPWYKPVLIIKGKPNSLTPTQHNLLTTFESQPNITLSRDFIVRAVWEMEPNPAIYHMMGSHIYRLRKIFRSNHVEPPIANVRGTGYRLDDSSKPAASA